MSIRDSSKRRDDQSRTEELKRMPEALLQHTQGIGGQSGHGEEIVVRRRGFLAASPSVDLSVAMVTRLRAGVLAGHTLVLSRLSGPGTVFVHAAGDFAGFTLGPGEVLRADTAALVWFDASVDYSAAWAGTVKRALLGGEGLLVPLRDRCSFGRSPWLISQALSVTYMAGERRLYLERNCRLPESPAHSRRRNREESASSKGLKGQRGFGPAVEPRRKSRPRSTSLHGSSPCKCQRLSTLRWDRLPPSRPSTKSWARAGGRRLSDRRLHRWLAGTSASAPSSHGAADLLGLNRAHICVRNQIVFEHLHGARAGHAADDGPRARRRASTGGPGVRPRRARARVVSVAAVLVGAGVWAAARSKD